MGNHPLYHMTPLFTAETYSHGVRITGFDRDLFSKFEIFLDQLRLKEPRRVPNGPVVMEVRKKYYGLTENHRELFLHRNSYPALVKFLSARGVDTNRINEVAIPAPTPVPITVQIKTEYTLFDYQEPIVEHLAGSIYSSRLDLQTGKGKAGWIDSLVKIPGGWKRMGDIQIGDTVTAWDGTPTSVTGVFPQGKKPLYKVTFADGRSTEVCGEHLWQSFYVNTSVQKRWQVRDTHELMRLLAMPNPRVYVPLCEAENVPDVALPIPPYTLGVILGDGYIGKSTVQISKPDIEVFESIHGEILDGHRLSQLESTDRCTTMSLVRSTAAGTNNYLNQLKALGLAESRSGVKFIPEVYLHTSRAQRLALLQGLMDTDGTVNTQATGGAISFNSTSYRLAKGVQYLVRSLGGIASISVRQTRYSYNGEKRNGRDSYDVNIRYKKPSELFTLPRKKERTNDNNQYAKDLKLRVVSIEPVGCKEAQCISIEHPDRLYVTDDFIVTHNTLCALASIARRAERTVVMVPPKYFGIWVKALKETIVDIEGRYCTVSGSDELQLLIDRGLEGDLAFDFIIISNVTYRMYIEAYERLGAGIKSLGYSAPPPRFHEAIGAGIQINDEIQEDPGLVFRTDVFTNVAKQMYLSATPYTGNAYVTQMIDVGLPQETHCEIPQYDSYVNVVGLLYSDISVQSKDYLTPYKNTYNHARYEKQMLKNKKRLQVYFALVKRIVVGIYARDRLPGQKLLILCAYVDFIKALTAYLKKEFHALQIGEFVSGSDFTTLQTNDITVSTIKSAGTGQDIRGLREVLLLQAIDSRKDNMQIIGRLRKLRDFPDVTPRLTYMVCQNIRHHLRYHETKKEYFAGKAKSHRTMQLG